MKKMRTIEEFAKSGEHHDVMDALSLLTHAYISQCGISLGDRSVIYVAAERWLERLAWMDLPLSEMARKYPLVCIMPHITSEYDPELYDEYDICGMDKKELLSVCRQILMDELFDEATNEVLCWGIIKATEERKKHSQEIETTAHDGTCLKGILTDQQLGYTYLTMTSPFEGIHISKCELVRDAKELLITGYEDYQRLHNMEREIRALYPKYQEELKKCENKSLWKKFRIFDDVYNKLIGDTVLSFPGQLFNVWFGLEINNNKNQKYEQK